MQLYVLDSGHKASCSLKCFLIVGVVVLTIMGSSAAINIPTDCAIQGGTTLPLDAMCGDVLKNFSQSCSYGTEIVSTDCDNGTLAFAGWFICSPAYCNKQYELYWEKMNTVRIKHSQ